MTAANTVSAEAQHILASNLAWDNHGCMPLRGNDTEFLPQLARYRDSGFNGVGIFLGENDSRSETIARHIDYVVETAGIDHVGIGLDYVFDMEELNEYVRQNPDTFPPEGGYADGVKFVEPEQAPEIVDALLGLGYRDEDIAKILGGNLMRVARAVWK